MEQRKRPWLKFHKISSEVEEKFFDDGECDGCDYKEKPFLGKFCYLSELDDAELGGSNFNCFVLAFDILFRIFYSQIISNFSQFLIHVFIFPLSDVL